MRPSAVRTVLAVVIVGVLLVVAVPIALLGFGPTSVQYSFGHGTLSVQTGSWLDGARDIPSSAVVDARAVTLSGARRTRGTGMPGYCAGRWSYTEIGPVWQATDCSRDAVLLTTRDGELPVVVTPPDREAFIQALRSGTDFHLALPPPAAGSPLRIAMLVVLLGLCVPVVMVTATLLRGPSRMVYRVGEGQLEVRTIFGRRAWPLADFGARLHQVKLQLRLAGTSAPGYQTGFFLADGKKTRVYATTTTGVLLEGPTRLFLSPEDPAGFLEALRGEGAVVAS